MCAWKLIQSGSPATVYRAPADPWVAAFVGDAVLLPATVSGATAHTALGRIPVVDPPTATGRVTVLIRPEHLRVANQPTAAGVPATVTGHDFHGHDALLGLRLADGTPVTARVLGIDGPPEVGGTVTLTVDGHGRVYPERRPTNN
jgi:iron(III) transport system ATP-binding protein